jgi:hypothetical protein
MTALTTWMDKLSATAIRYALEREYRPTAFLSYADGRQERVRLDGGGSDHARDMRAMAMLREPAMMALLTESWTIRKDLTLEDPDVRRVAMAEILPSQLPPAKRGELLTMYAESADGEHYTKVWYIVKDARERRRIRLEPQEVPENATTRFWPVFIVDDLLRGLAAGTIDAPAPIVAMLKDLSADMTTEEQRLHIRKMLAYVLLSGGGGTSRQFERESHAAHRQAIEWIVKGGPAVDRDKST